MDLLFLLLNILLTVVTSAIAFRYASYAGVVFVLAVRVGIYSRWRHACRRAGPRTTRQIPPQVVPRCIQMSATELHNAFKEGSLTSLQVTMAYIELIQAVNPYVNGIVFERFDEAIMEAKEADRVWEAWRRQQHGAGKRSGSMEEPSLVLGVPCTIKECMSCKGCPNTSGNPYRAETISTEDSPVVANFRRAGAIILGVTNVSELCMWYESSNYMYGISCNPFDTRCIVGGSSGGEGVCAGAAMSCFGIGSDIGGSIRMPAFFNGVYGFKATPHLICTIGQHPPAQASANHHLAVGPLTRFAEDLLALSHIAAEGGFQRDAVRYPPARPLPETPVSFFTKASKRAAKEPLRVYLLEDYGVAFLTVSESQKQAVRLAGKAMVAAHGDQVELITVDVRHPSRCTGGAVPAAFKNFSQSLSFWTHEMTCDPEETCFSTSMEEGMGVGVNWGSELLRWMGGRSKHTLPAIGLCMIEQYEKNLPSFMSLGHAGNILKFRSELDELMGNNSVIIAPTFPSPAPRHHAPLWTPFHFQYTAIFNVLRMPAVACPVWVGEEMEGRVTAMSIDEAREAHLPDDFHLPKGVQVTAVNGNDALIMEVASILDKQLHGYHYPSWAVLE